MLGPGWELEDLAAWLERTPILITEALPRWGDRRITELQNLLEAEAARMEITLIRISPSLWKPVMRGLGLGQTHKGYPPGLSSHEQDALGLLRYAKLRSWI
jgi:hypothetical protein